jgi:hypothetical protein
MGFAAQAALPALRFRPALRAAALAAGASIACALARLSPDASPVATVAAGLALVALYVAAGVAMGAIRRRDFDLIRAVVAGAVPEPVDPPRGG